LSDVLLHDQGDRSLYVGRQEWWAEFAEPTAGG
jgi:hypothetical protein